MSEWSPLRQGPEAPFQYAKSRLHPAHTSAHARVQGMDYGALPPAGAGGMQVTGFSYRLKNDRSLSISVAKDYPVPAEETNDLSPQGHPVTCVAPAPAAAPAAAPLTTLISSMIGLLPVEEETYFIEYWPRRISLMA